MATAAYIARALAGNYGITPVEVSEPNDLEDGDIKFSEFAGSHVQVGFNYACVVHETDDGKFIFRPYRKSLSALYNDLKR